MNNKANPEKYRKLSIAALVTGILTVLHIILTLIGFNWSGFLDEFVIYLFPFYIVCFPLPIIAIVCGSIDLKRIKSGLYSKKGRGMDITGITLGSLYFISVICIIIYYYYFISYIFPNLPRVEVWI